jgi:stage V sporulation protein S
MSVLRVSTTSDPAATAGAIASGIRTDGVAEIHVIGPRAVNQAVKAIAIARSYLAASGVDAYCVPNFTSMHVEGDDEEKTGIHFLVCPRHDFRQSSVRTVAD